MSATEHEFVLDTLIGDAIEILVDRALRTGPPPKNVGWWRGEMVREKHTEHDRRAGALLADDPAITPKALADLLEPVTLDSRRRAHGEPTPSAVYALAEQRRRERAMPDEWLAPDVFTRCIAAARAALPVEEDQ